jgi:ATP synthase protein I
MMTNSAPKARPDATGRVVAGAAAGCAIATAIVLVVAAVVADRTAVLGALTGAGLVLAFFGFGAVVVTTVARAVPAATLLVALVTFTLQVVLLGAVFALLREADVLGSDLDARWLAGTLIAGTIAWLTGQVVLTLRTPLHPISAPGSRREEAGAAW